MKNILRAVGFLALSLVVGELVKRVLTSRAGESAMTRLGRPELATVAGAHAASKEAKRAVGLVRRITAPKSAEPEEPVVPAGTPRWALVARDAAEMLLAAGTVLRTASDFVHEDQKIKTSVSRFARRS